MKVTKSRYGKIDALSKIFGLAFLAISIDNVSKGNYVIALLLFGLGGLIGIVPFYIKIGS
jgi:hypothetical protein